MELALIIRAVCLLGLLLVATYTDVRAHKIYNWTTYPGILLGFFLSWYFEGVGGFQNSFSGFLACGLIMIVCFLLFDIGGGDVKLIAMMGAFLGLYDGIQALLITFIFGSAMGMVILIWQCGVWHLISKITEHLQLVFRAKGWVSPTDEEREPLKRWLFLAPSAFAAAVIVLSEPWMIH
jgi:prepilin peptidase CpaA